MKIDWNKPIEYIINNHIYPAKVIAIIKGSYPMVVVVNFDEEERVFNYLKDADDNPTLRNKEPEKKYKWINLYKSRNTLYMTQFDSEEQAKISYEGSKKTYIYIDIARKIEIPNE